MSYDPYKPTFGVGARVMVVRQRKYPNEKLKGLVGTVRTDSGSNVSVIFDTIKNTRSSYGCFYFKAVELVEVDENVNEIMEENNMEKYTNYVNIAKITPISDSNSTYYYANFDANLKVDDICVVTGLTKIRMNDSNAPRGFTVARVVGIEDVSDFSRDLVGEVVTKVDTTAYNTRVRNRIKAAELKAKMESRAKQLQDIALYQMLAKDDPDMAALLNEYKNIPQI